MKVSTLLLPLLALACAQAHAVTTIVDFDGLISGSIANLDPGVIGFALNNATLTPNLDSFGSPIPGSDHWVPDPIYGSATVANSFDAGYGTAPTGAITLDGSQGPLLLNFDTPVTLNSFAITLDTDTFGSNLFTADFYGPGDTLLASVPVFQTTPGFIVNAPASLNGVSYVVLPSGAMYDHLAVDFTPVPEPSGIVLLLGALAPLVRRRRR